MRDIICPMKPGHELLVVREQQPCPFLRQVKVVLEGKLNELVSDSRERRPYILVAHRQLSLFLSAFCNQFLNYTHVFDSARIKVYVWSLWHFGKSGLITQYYM